MVPLGSLDCWMSPWGKSQKRLWVNSDLHELDCREGGQDSTPCSTHPIPPSPCPCPAQPPSCLPHQHTFSSICWRMELAACHLLSCTGLVSLAMVEKGIMLAEHTFCQHTTSTAPGCKSLLKYDFMLCEAERYMANIQRNPSWINFPN